MPRHALNPIRRDVLPRVGLPRIAATLVISVLFLFLALGLSAGQNGDTRLHHGVSVGLSPSESAWLKAHPEVRWGCDPAWPPFCSLGKDGKAEGIDPDITRLVAERVGLRLKLVSGLAWSEV